MVNTDLIIAGISALLGGAGTKLFDFLFLAKKDKADSTMQLIDRMQNYLEHLNKKVDNMQQEIDAQRKELDEWKSKYYSMHKKYNELLRTQKPKNN